MEPSLSVHSRNEWGDVASAWRFKRDESKDELMSLRKSPMTRQTSPVMSLAKSHRSPAKSRTSPVMSLAKSKTNPVKSQTSAVKRLMKCLYMVYTTMFINYMGRC